MLRRLGSALGRMFGRSYRSYDAAKPSRQRYDWNRRNTGPNAIGAAVGTTLRARSRDLVRNDAHCARAIEVLAGSIVGTGIEPRAVDSRQSRRSTRLQQRADELWADFARYADVEGQHSLQALTYVAVRGWLEAGEVFIRRVFDRSSSRPLQIQVLEADLLDESRTGLKAENGNRIELGIELDGQGRRVAYHFRSAHPGENATSVQSTLAPGDVVRVPAQDVIHLFLPLRPGQLRGVPFLAPIMAMKKDLNDFETFELLRKKTEALVVAFVTPGENASPGDDDDSLAPTVENADGEQVGDLRPAAILSTANGKEVRFNTPIISANYDVYKKAMLQSIAVGMQLTYETLTGDLSNVNYTSYRAGHIQFNAYIDRLQWNHFIPVVMDRLWDWRMEAGYLAGQIASAEVPREWSPPKRISVDPGADALADILEIRGGLALLDDKQAERGYQPSRFFELQARTNAAIDAWSAVIDSDPRKQAFRGASPALVQPYAPATPLAGEGSSTPEPSI